MNPTKNEMTVLGLRFLPQLNHPSRVYTDTSSLVEEQSAEMVNIPASGKDARVPIGHWL